MGSGTSKRPATASGTPVTSPYVGGHVISRHVSVPNNFMVMSPTQSWYQPNYYAPQVPQIPPPQPPRCPKSEVFTLEKYGTEVDKHVARAPGSLMVSSFQELAQYLTRSHYHWDEMCKVRAIFLWVATVDVYGLRPEAQPPPNSPLEYLVKIQQNAGNHANLIHYLCQFAGIPCHVINGMNKSAAYEVGDKCDRKKMAAQWNAVHVNGDWRFLDAFWASSCVVGRKSGEWTLVDADGKITQEDEEASEGKAQHRLNEFYFLPDPDKLICTHFPDDARWQLLQNPATLKDFEERVYVREAFHQIGMGLLPKSHDRLLLESVDGEIELVFSLPVDKSASSKFMYMLYFGGKKTSEGDSNVSLHRFVMFEQTTNLLRFSLRFPVRGKFKMDILGVDTKASNSKYDIACSYIIMCKEPKKSCLPLPDAPSIGWGPGANAAQAGLKPITHEDAIILTKDGNVEIRLGTEKNIQLHQMLRHALIDDATLSNYAVTRLENGQAVVNIRLPHGGEYALKLYADDVGTEGIAPNVLNYLIKAEGKAISNVPFPNVSGGALSRKPVADSLGVSALSHKDGMVKVKNGRERITFQAPDDVIMMAELHTSDKHACKSMKVKPVQSNGKWSFHIDLPEKGEYSLNVFACYKNDKDRIYNVHSYMVTSDGWEMEDDDTEETEEIKPVVEHVPVETVQTSENEVLVPVPAGFEDVCASLHRRNANDPPGRDQVGVDEQEGVRFVRAALPEFGEYQLSLYDRDEKGVVRNVAKYQINRKPAGELYEDNTKMLMQNIGAQRPLVDDEDKSLEAASDNGETNGASGETEENDMEEDMINNLEGEQRRAARRQIRKAMDMKDVELLRHRINAYEKLGAAADDELLAQARKTLAMLEAKEELILACQKRDLDTLKKAISRAKAANRDHQLDLQLAVAHKLRERLEKLAKLQHAVLNLDGKTVAEIRTYSNPPDGVHQSMMATFLLLGNTPKEVKNWKTCQALLGKTGRESLMRRISKFDPQDCSVGAARQAKQTMGEYSMTQIRDVSAGAATFFTWSQGMIEEVESTGGSGPGKQR